MRARLKIVILVMTALALPLGPGGAPARAAGAGTFALQVSGTLPKFPTASSTATFSGTTTGNATVAAVTGGSVYTANLHFKTAPVQGSVEYGVAYSPYCPAVATAAPNPNRPWYGWVTMDVPAPAVSGIVYRAGDTLTGIVTRVQATFRFNYDRAGAAAALVVSDGKATVHFATPGRPSATIVTPFTGAGGALVTFDNPAQVVTNCQNNGGPPIGFKMVGDVNLA